MLSFRVKGHLDLGPYRSQTAQGLGGQAQKECRFTWGVQGMGAGDSGPAVWNMGRWIGQIKTHPRLCHLSSSRETKQSPQSQSQMMLWSLPQEGFIQNSSAESLGADLVCSP